MSSLFLLEQVFVLQSLARNALNRFLRPFTVCHLARVPTETKFISIALQVGLAHLVVDPYMTKVHPIVKTTN